MHMSRSQSLTNVKVYIQIYIDIYFRVSLGGHNLGIFYDRNATRHATYTDLNL